MASIANSSSSFEKHRNRVLDLIRFWSRTASWCTRIFEASPELEKSLTSFRDEDDTGERTEKSEFENEETEESWLRNIWLIPSHTRYEGLTSWFLFGGEMQLALHCIAWQWQFQSSNVFQSPGHIADWFSSLESFENTFLTERDILLTSDEGNDGPSVLPLAEGIRLSKTSSEYLYFQTAEMRKERLQGMSPDISVWIEITSCWMTLHWHRRNHSLQTH